MTVKSHQNFTSVTFINILASNSKHLKNEEKILAIHPTFKRLVEIYHAPRKPKPWLFESKNFQEFKKVYGEKKYSVNESVSVRPKNDLKTIQLKIPTFGSEKAIVPLPFTKKNNVRKSCLKKPIRSSLKDSTAAEFLDTLEKYVNWSN